MCARTAHGRPKRTMDFRKQACVYPRADDRGELITGCAGFNSRLRMDGASLLARCLDCEAQSPTCCFSPEQVEADTSWVCGENCACWAHQQDRHARVKPHAFFEIWAASCSQRGRFVGTDYGSRAGGGKWLVGQCKGAQPKLSLLQGASQA